jgi:hypothetical protein
MNNRDIYSLETFYATPCSGLYYKWFLTHTLEDWVIADEVMHMPKSFLISFCWMVLEQS